MITTKTTDRMYASARTVITDEKPTLTHDEMLHAYPTNRNYNPAAAVVIGEDENHVFRMVVPCGRKVSFRVNSTDNRTLPLRLWRYVVDVYVLDGTGCYKTNEDHVLENRSAFDLVMTTGGTELPKPASCGRLYEIGTGRIRSVKVMRNIMLEPDKIMFYAGQVFLAVAGTLLPLRGRSAGWGIVPLDTNGWYGLTWPADDYLERGWVQFEEDCEDVRLHPTYADVVRYLSENN